MKFKTKTFGLWVCIVLLVNQASSEGVKQLVDDIVLPSAIKIVPALGIPPPVGPIIVAALSVMQIASNLVKFEKPEVNREKEIEEQIKQIREVDLKEIRTVIVEHFETMKTHLLQESARIIRELLMVIETNGFFEDLRQTVDYLQRTFNDMNDIVIDPQVNGTQKTLILHDMLSYSSDYRYKLRSFISKFIKANVNELMLFKPSKLFYDFILEKDRYLASTDDNCSSDSMHNKIYKSFIFMLKILTDGYSMVVAAHVVQYQEELSSEIESAHELGKNALSLIKEYKRDAKILIETTQLALNQASREIRNCGAFHLEEGKTFERVSFSHMLPKIHYFEYIDVFYYKCRSETDFANLTLYDFGACNSYTDDIPFGSEIKIPLDIHKRPVGKGPFNFMSVKTNDTEVVFGHIKSKEGPKIEYSFKNHPECYTTFCTTYRQNLYAISTKRVEASPGYVITGLRFRVRNRVIYIDIQQGKFLNILSVDPGTVHWLEAPESNEIEYLGSGLNKFELGDFKLKKNSLLRCIQLTKASLHKGLIRVFIDGLTPPDMNNTDSVSYENYDLQLNELQLIEADDPTQMDNVGTKNIVSKPPVADQRYFVKFQPTDFKKDFGQTTVPLLDIRDVSSNPPAPLNGFGFYHESVDGSGGLIGIKLITPNMNDYVDILNEN